MRYELIKPLIELTDRHLPEIVLAYACGVCGRVDTHAWAGRCCARKFCDCGNEIVVGAYTACPVCINKAADKRKIEKYEAAKKVKAEDYNGPVFHENRDRFYSDISEAVEYVADDLESLDDLEKQIFYTCTTSHLVLNADEIIDSAFECQDHCEDTYDSISGVDELKNFITTWNEEHGKSVATWFPSTEIIIVPKDWWEIGSLRGGGR